MAAILVVYRPRTDSIALWEGVARNIVQDAVTRINLLKIRHSELRVFEVESKTRNVLPNPKIAFSDMLHASIFRASAYREKSSLQIVSCNITLMSKISACIQGKIPNKLFIIRQLKKSTNFYLF
ncbi:MAG: hypothetical protein AAF419_04690 [Pseudomonadota bacterium]